MAKQRIIWSYRAKLDLLGILDFYYKRNGSKTYSIKLNSSFRKAVRIIQKYPKIGHQTDIANTRVLIENNYAIFYKVEVNTIEISTIWDCRQNPTAIEH
jgi:plasmid stabilization system protein ParE